MIGQREQDGVRRLATRFEEGSVVRSLLRLKSYPQLLHFKTMQKFHGWDKDRYLRWGHWGTITARSCELRLGAILQRQWPPL
jgi:hypothetical protein